MNILHKIIQWLKNPVACWNHERTLRRFARSRPSTLKQVKMVYRWVSSYEKLESIIDLAQREGITLCNAHFRVLHKESHS